MNQPPSSGTSAGKRAPIDFYFDFISSYGYFASLRIEDIAARHGCTVRWHSMLLGVSVMKVMGLKPLLETPLKGDYVQHDAARYMRRHGLMLARKISDPMMDPRPAARAFYWVRRHHPNSEAAFARAVYDRYWRLGKDLSLPQEIAAVAAQEPTLGIDPEALRAGEASDEARQDLREAVAASIECGVFGSPFVLVDGEPFWGSDRLDVLDEWLACGGW
ncbi:MAG: 2-hydroxychromene-2-carboxylate isomerase [Hydrogenophaga sp.]|uniref:2-hydroxychromene-2-carboxylate isomerase n=1 Tax=Hydrogenophaga sp. TaxID=1904254 RepID=UPI002612B677|nr:2-hydroxychromene-2-carboxylate isomerase [Hydrogenophaga sp.]MDM7941590.1 2-hydroxychromene-2-carboxylate isomerase [Hydrogenophaga sp.]